MRIDSLTRRLVFGCAIVLAAQAAASGFSSVFPTGLTIARPGTQPGYVIFGAPDGHAYAIDVEGNVAKKWSSPEPNMELNYTRPLANGNLLARIQPVKPSSGVAGGNGEASGVIEMTQDGRVVWKYVDRVRSLHHDMERMSNGNTLLVCSKELDLPHVSRRLLTDDCLIEVDPSGNVVWEWQTADHFEELEVPQDVREQIMSGYPSGRRIGLGAPPQNKGFDYLHMNAASPIPDSAGHVDARFKPGNVIVSYRYISTLAVVDRDTKKVVWKTPAGFTIGQHNPHFLPAGVPGTGRVLVFDNGLVESANNPFRFLGRPYSRVVEIDPADQSIAWEYTAEKSRRPMWSFFSHYIGGTQRLANGNTLICEGANGRIFEVTPAGDVVWEYVNPFSKVTRDIPSNTVFRAAKVPNSWLKS